MPEEDDDLLIQFPKDYPMSTIDDVLPEDDPYSNVYDEVIVLKRDKYTEAEALERFPELCALRKCRGISPPFRTATHFCLRVVKL